MKTRSRLLLAVLFGVASAGTGVSALELSLPIGAALTVERTTKLDSFEAPIGPFNDGIVPRQTLEGTIIRRAWRIPVAGLTPLQVMVPLREQLVAQGFDLAYECAAASCGGFDFRFAVEVLSSPNMYVNIASFRYLTAFEGPREDPTRAVGVLVSVTAASSYVQVILADTRGDDMLPVREVAPTELPEIAMPAEEAVEIVEDALLSEGFMVLDDLEFDTGTSDLGPGPYASLVHLADVLRARDDLRVALVGHTDTVGGLEPNIVLSRDRARSVRARLVETYGVAEDRLDAEGMGYLAPRASNLTAEGREKNRRVEAILLNVTE